MRNVTSLMVLVVSVLFAGPTRASEGTDKLSQRRSNDTSSQPSQSESFRSPEELLELGKSLYLAGKFRWAAETLDEARSASSDRRTSAQIYLYLGLSRAAEGEGDVADAFEQALRRDPALELSRSDYRPVVVDIFEGVRQRLKGRLRITTPDDDIRLMIDGAPTLALDPLELTVGRHNVSASEGDDEPYYEHTVIVDPDRIVELTIPSPPPPRIWTWVSLAAAAGAAGAGTAFWFVAQSDADEANMVLGGIEDPNFEDSDRQAAYMAYEEAKNASNRNAIWAYALWGVAGALAVTSAILYVWEGGTSERTRSHSAATSSRVDSETIALLPLVGLPLGLHGTW